jgi:hypothetical protein
MRPDPSQGIRLVHILNPTHLAQLVRLGPKPPGMEIMSGGVSIYLLTLPRCAFVVPWA